MRLICALAWADAVHDRRLFACFALTVAAVLAPMLLLLGLRVGVVDYLLGGLRADPNNLQVRHLGHRSPGFDADWFAAMRARPDVAYIAPRTRDLSLQRDVSSAGAPLRVRRAELVLSGPGDVQLGALAMLVVPGQAVVTDVLATQLGVKTGDDLLVWATGDRASGRERTSITLRIAAIAPPGTYARAAVFAEPAVGVDLEDFGDDRAVPPRGWAGRDPPMVRPFPSFRVYASSIEAVPGLEAYLRSLDMTVQSNTSMIQWTLTLDRNLLALFGILVGCAGAGVAGALGASIYANVARKRHSLALLRLLGVTPQALALFPLLQAAMVAIAGVSVSVAVALSVGQMINVAYAGTYLHGAPLCHIPMDAVLLGSLGTIVVAVLSGSVAMLPVLRIAPAEGVPAAMIARFVIRTITALLAAVLAGMAAAQSTDEDWNPKKAEGDLVLPLPCGVGLVFRKIATPVGGDTALSDRRILLGDAETSIPYKESVREAFIAGAFGADAGAHFWLGKYEVTQQQYAAVIKGCDAAAALPQRERRLPQTSVTWLEAMQFAQRATEAIYQARKDLLPGVGEVRAHLRLPTEAEWEYAARGGKPDDPDFRASLPPMPGGVTAYANLRRTGERPRLQPIGSLKPNGLELYDLFGNAAELVLGPFHLARGGRPGGQIGGLTARGGDAGLAQDQLRTSLRIEFPATNPNGSPYSYNLLGFRVALGLQIQTSLGADGALRRAWDEEVSRPPQDLDPAQDPRILAQHLEDQLLNQAQKQAVVRIRRAVEEERSKRTQAEEASVRSAIGAGAVLVREIRNSANSADNVAKNLAELERQAAGPGPPASLANSLEIVRGTFEAYSTSRETAFAILSTLILRLAEAPPAQFDGQMKVWLIENPGPAFTNLRRFAGLLADEVAKARSARAVPHDPVIARLRTP